MLEEKLIGRVARFADRREDWSVFGFETARATPAPNAATSVLAVRQIPRICAAPSPRRLSRCRYNHARGKPHPGSLLAKSHFPELFPTQIRSTGVAFCNGAARIITSFGPLIAGLLAAALGGFSVAAAIMVCFALLSVVAMLMGRETKGSELPH